MKLILLTSDGLRHRFVAHQLAKKHRLLAVFAEKAGSNPGQNAENPADLEVVKKHFALRDRVEKKFFGRYEKFPSGRTKVFLIDRGTLNSSETITEIKSFAPEGIAVYGSGIVGEEIIDLCPGKIINIHLGLSPYYRGSGTNFWPFFNREIQYAGYTIHHIDKGIDTGPIITQGQPRVAKADGLHDIGCKIISRAVKDMASVFEVLQRAPIKGVRQKKGGKLYLKKDFNADIVRSTYDSIGSGLIKAYAKDQEALKKKVKLVKYGFR